MCRRGRSVAVPWASGVTFRAFSVSGDGVSGRACCAGWRTEVGGERPDQTARLGHERRAVIGRELGEEEVCLGR